MGSRKKRENRLLHAAFRVEHAQIQTDASRLRDNTEIDFQNF